MTSKWNEGHGSSPYIDKYQEDEHKPMAYVTSYLYGNPYLEEWENRHRTYFHDIKNVINNDNEEN